MKTEVLPIRLEKKIKEAFKDILDGESMSLTIRKFIKAYLKNPEATEKFINKNYG